MEDKNNKNIFRITKFVKSEGGWNNADSVAESIIRDSLTFYWMESWKQDFPHW